MFAVCSIPQGPSDRPRPTFSPSPRSHAALKLTRLSILKRQQYVVQALLAHSIKGEKWEEVADLTKKLNDIDSRMKASADTETE